MGSLLDITDDSNRYKTITIARTDTNGLVLQRCVTGSVGKSGRATHRVCIVNTIDRAFHLYQC